jgi:hypothetical protein
MAYTGAVIEFGCLIYAGMIRCKTSVAVKKLRKKTRPQGKPVRRKWLEPCKTLQPSRQRSTPMSDKVRKIVEQRILTNLAISRARASVRAAKREKARAEAQRVDVELEQETVLSEPDNPKSSKGSRRPPNPLTVYRNYLERCKAASHTRVKRFGRESVPGNITYPTAEPGPSSVSDQPNVASAGQSLKYHNDADARKVSAGKVTFNESLPGSCNKLGSTGISKCAQRTKDLSKKMEKSLSRETDESEESNQIDQPGTSKRSDIDDENVFKKPFPVKQKAPRHKTNVKEVGKQNVKIRDGRCEVVKKINASGRKFPLLKYLHPAVLANQRKTAVRMTKLLLEKGWLHKKKPNVRKRQTGKMVDLFETLHDIVLFICEQVSYPL